LRSGAPLAAPAFDPLPHWEVAIEDSFVRVRNPAPFPTPSRVRHNTGSDERVIGGGAAGFAAVDMLLRSSFAGEIAMISDDMAPPYDRTFAYQGLPRRPFRRRFLPPQVADLIVASGSEEQLESHRREITALFCDLRGFTGFTESADAEDVMALLRDYHARRPKSRASAPTKVIRLDVAHSRIAQVSSVACQQAIWFQRSIKVPEPRNSRRSLTRAELMALLPPLADQAR
jgi:hypothetical protein